MNLDFAISQKINFYSRPCGRGDEHRYQRHSQGRNFYSRPCGRGDQDGFLAARILLPFLLTPLREGRRRPPRRHSPSGLFLLTPLREGRPDPDAGVEHLLSISTHAPAGGATTNGSKTISGTSISTHAPAGGATKGRIIWQQKTTYFYSRPCGRGDRLIASSNPIWFLFLLTPLREGRHSERRPHSRWRFISTHAPAGGATV